MDITEGSVVGAMPIAEVGISETTLQLAEAHGKFYKSLIDTYLGADSAEDKLIQQDQLVENLPPHARNLYKEGIKRYQEELEANHNLLSQHKGDEVKYLLNSVLYSDQKTDSEIQEILKRATPDEVRFIEPTPGVAILETEKGFFRFLQEHGVIIRDNISAVAISSYNRVEPSFMVVSRLSFQKSLSEEGVMASKDLRLRHEFHHFIWNFLERSKFVRAASETTPELTKAFKHFRSELSSYILEKISIGRIEIDRLVYSQDEEIVRIATDTKNYIATCMEVAIKQGVVPESFLYASMTSRNFEELKSKTFELIPLPSVIDIVSLNSLYSAWWSPIPNYVKETFLSQLVSQKGVKFPPELLNEFALSALQSTNIINLEDMRDEFYRFSRFIKAIDSKSSLDSRILEKVLRVRLPIPKETIPIILGLSEDLSRNVHLGGTVDTFIQGFISYLEVDDQAVRDTYSELLNSSPVLRQAFDRVKDNIIQEYANVIRSQSHQQIEETEARIEAKSKAILSL